MKRPCAKSATPQVLSLFTTISAHHGYLYMYINLSHLCNGTLMLLERFLYTFLHCTNFELDLCIKTEACLKYPNQLIVQNSKTSRIISVPLHSSALNTQSLFVP